MVAHICSLGITCLRLEEYLNLGVWASLGNIKDFSEREGDRDSQRKRRNEARKVREED